MAELNTILRLDGEEYDISSLSEHGQSLIVKIRQIDILFDEKNQLMSAIGQAYEALKRELSQDLVVQKTGIDLSQLFSED
jgi:hypothetical protein